MEQRLDCITVQDLLPNYVEKLTNEITGRRIEAHMKGCSECRHLLSQLTTEVLVEKAPETKEFKHYLTRSKIEFVVRCLIWSGLLSIVVCLIVDLAVSHKLTWSLIAAGGVLLAVLPANIALRAQYNKIIKALGCLSGCLYVYLFLIEAVANRFFLESPIHWFFPLALPITTVWLAGLWITIFAAKKTKLGEFGISAIICFLCVPGNLLTNWITNGGIVDRADLMINAVSVFLTGIVLFILEKKLKLKKSIRKINKK